jgi:peroxiredoxin Q/BCP
LARLRDGYDDFTKHGAEILAVGPNSPAAFERYWENEQVPFIGLPDPGHSVAKMYRQQIKLFKLGRMPLNCIVDLSGLVRYIHYGESMRDIPSNEDLLRVIDELNASSK